MERRKDIKTKENNFDMKDKYPSHEKKYEVSHNLQFDQIQLSLFRDNLIDMVREQWIRFQNLRSDGALHG